jgi:hypothetical protein
VCPAGATEAVGVDSEGEAEAGYGGAVDGSGEQMSVTHEVEGQYLLHQCPPLQDHLPMAMCHLG